MTSGSPHKGPLKRKAFPYHDVIMILSGSGDNGSELYLLIFAWPHFYQTRSAWSMDQGSIRNRSAFHNFVPTVTKFCAMWEGLSLPHGTKFGNCRGEIVDRRVIFILILDPWIKLIRFDKSGTRADMVYWINREMSLLAIEHGFPYNSMGHRWIGELAEQNMTYY